MFQNCQVCEFCRLEFFQYRAFAAPFKALTLLHTLRRIQPLQTYINFTQRLPDTSSRYPGTLQDNNRHQQTPNNTSRRCQTPKKAVQGYVADYFDIKWRLLASDGVWWRPLLSMLSANVKRVSESCLWIYLRFECIYGYKGVVRACMV